jgi:hypothetical protein
MSILNSQGQRLLIEVAADGGLESLSGASTTEAGVGRTTRVATLSTGSSLHPWDQAHRALADPRSVGLEAVAAPAYAEPDFVQTFPHQGPDDTGLESFAAAVPCRPVGLNPNWPPSAVQFAWHLADEFSGLRAARNRVGEPGGRRVRIAILDTGYDPNHITLPRHLMTELQRNFVDGDPTEATDPGRHFPLNNPGHGTATLALLAGNRVQPAGSGFDDFLGGAPFAEIVPVRIADSVVHFRTSSMAAGIEYAVAAGCDVVSISMGGVPTRAWATAVNRAYEAGVAIFAAAGNRIGLMPPAQIVYPARFDRVVAVCGVTADRSPFFKEGLHRLMHGCFGPPAKMVTAIAAYTPNTPWAAMGCQTLINPDGNGTSSATPQAAAAAALWLQQAGLPAGIEPWQKVEAVRHALFTSADKSVPEVEKYFGQGLLRAHKALDVPFRVNLPKSPPATVEFPWLRMLGALEAATSGRELMYEVEALQIYEQSPHLQDMTGTADPLNDKLDAATRKRLTAELRDSPLASQSLREYAARVYRQL